MLRDNDNVFRKTLDFEECRVLLIIEFSVLSQS